MAVMQKSIILSSCHITLDGSRVEYGLGIVNIFKHIQEAAEP